MALSDEFINEEVLQLQGSPVAKTSKKKKSQTGKKPIRKGQSAQKRSLLRTILRYVTGIVLFLFMLPIVLTVIYRFEIIHPVSTLMITRTLTFQPVNRDWQSIDDIAPSLVQSVMMSEDGKFCTHGGVDWVALRGVIDNAMEGERTRGASTLTMQTVKNLFLWNSRSYLRKGLEIPLALWLDLILPKKRIMEIYLNIAEWDEFVFGAEAASRLYFKKSSKKLSYRQASLLAVTLPNPRNRDASKPGRRMNKHAKIIQRRAKTSGAYVGCVN